MQYRGLMQLALLLLVGGCMLLGMFATLVSLVIFMLAIELLAWSKLLQENTQLTGERGLS